MREPAPPHFKSASSPSPRSGLTTIAVWVLALIASVLALSGAYFLGVNNASVTEVEILIPTPAPIVVQVVGEVRSPGVYELDADERVLTAIQAAGGMTENADIEGLNVAAILVDGSRILVPSLPPTPIPFAENQPDISQEQESNSGAPVLQDAPSLDSLSGKIDINTATLEQLISLPGIGETRANQILAFRTDLGQISALEQLIEINGIGYKTLEAIRPFVVVR